MGTAEVAVSREIVDRGGRPRIPPSKQRCYRLQFLATTGEADALIIAARRAGLSISTYIRARLGLPTTEGSKSEK